MSRRLLALLAAILFFLAPGMPCAFGQDNPPAQYKVLEELNVSVAMRDGIRLSTNIYRPDTSGQFPALLIRSPYGNGGSGNREGHFFAGRGYAVVIQDTRGRAESEGVFDAFQPEALDGLDTQEWVASQPWCTGKIGTLGGSYVGFTQWLPAALGSPHLVTMFPVVTFADQHDMAYYGGAARLRLFTAWSLEMTHPYSVTREELEARMDSVFRHLPLIEQDRAAGWRVSFLRDWLSHPEHDSYWDRSSIGEGYEKIKASTYNVGGWFDICLSGTLINFMSMTSSAVDPEVRAKQKLLIGPWVHSLSRDGKVGELDFGPESVPSLQQTELRWFDNQLKGVDNGIMAEAPVKIFVMGANVWREEQEWPLARTKYTSYYLHSGGKANTGSGDGTLSTALPKAEAPDNFSYDPADPVPSTPDAPTDQRKLETRPDVLVFTSAALKKPLEVTGPVEAVLYAASSAPNTDFTAKLIDVYPDGRAIRLCDGIIRASFREGSTGTSNIEPGKVYQYKIDLWATSNLFLQDHRIRVEVSSSNFPRFDRNLNTGGTFAFDSTLAVAKQTIYHSREYPSYIKLPVIE